MTLLGIHTMGSDNRAAHSWDIDLLALIVVVVVVVVVAV